MPSFRRWGIDAAPQVPSFQQKLVGLRISIQVLDQIQIDCMGAINDRSFKGGSFLAKLAQEYGASLSFHPDGIPSHGTRRAKLFTRRKDGTCRGTKPLPALDVSHLQ